MHVQQFFGFFVLVPRQTARHPFAIQSLEAEIEGALMIPRFGIFQLVVVPRNGFFENPNMRLIEHLLFVHKTNQNVHL